MKASGPRQERETVISFNDEDDKVMLWTASDLIYRRLLKRLGRAYLIEDGERHAVFEFPRRWLVLPRFKAKRVLDPTRRALAAQRFADAVKNRVRDKRKPLS